MAAVLLFIFCTQYDPGVNLVSLFFRSSHSNEKQLPLGTEWSAEIQGDDIYVMYQNPQSSFLLHCPLQDTSQDLGNAHFVRSS